LSNSSSSGNLSDYSSLQNIHPVKFVYRILLERRLLLAWMIFGIITHQSLRFVIPVLVGNLVEFGLDKGDVNQVKFYAWLVLIIALISAILDITMSWANEIAANDVEYKTRNIYFNSVQGKTMAFHDESRMGELMSVAQNDLRSLYSTVAPGLRLFGESTISVIVVTLFIFIESVVLGFIFLLLLPFWLLSLRKYNRRMSPTAVVQQDYFRDLGALVKENLIGTKIVRAFSQEKREVLNFEKSNSQYTESWNTRGQATAFFVPMLLTYSLTSLMFIIGIYLTTVSSISILSYTLLVNFEAHNLITVMGIMILFRQPTFFVGATLELASLGLAGVDKVQKTLALGESEKSIIGTGLSDKKIDFEGGISFTNVSFGYSEKDVLSNISFEINPGETVAIVGPPGSGKTTLVKLLARFYETRVGIIAIDGQDIKSVPVDQLRRNIGVVEQDVHLFSTSILNNITYAVDDFSIEDIDEIAKLAQVEEFVKELPDKYDTLVGERGVRLSGGQRQRIAIARAFLSNPKILILDDSTSAVDGKTEHQIVTAITNLMKNRTNIIITNRLNMMRFAHKIIVLQQGTIVGMGTHEDLIKSNTIYRRIFQPYISSSKGGAE